METVGIKCLWLVGLIACLACPWALATDEAPYTRMGHTITAKPFFSDERGSILDFTMRFPVDGAVAQWTMYGHGEGEISMQVWRPKDVQARQFILVGENILHVNGLKGEAQVYNIPPSQRIPFKAGDFVGWRFRSGNKLIDFNRNGAVREVTPSDIMSRAGPLSADAGAHVPEVLKVDEGPVVWTDELEPAQPGVAVTFSRGEWRDYSVEVGYTRVRSNIMAQASGVSEQKSLNPHPIQSGSIWSTKLMGYFKRTWTGRIKFNSPFIGKPVVVAFSDGADFGPDNPSNNRLTVYATNIDKTGFVANVETWEDTILNSASYTWFAYEADTGIQSGKVWRGVNNCPDWNLHLSPPCAHGHSLRSYNHVVVFDRAFQTVPNVQVQIQAMDVKHSGAEHVRVFATDVDQYGFVLNFATWGDCQVFSLGASWIAHEVHENATVNAYYEMQSDDFLPPQYPLIPDGVGTRMETNHIEFPHRFRVGDEPTVVAALNTIDAPDAQNVRVDLSVSSVTNEGFDLHVHSWIDSSIHTVGISWLAFTPPPAKNVLEPPSRGQSPPDRLLRTFYPTPDAIRPPNLINRHKRAKGAGLLDVDPNYRIEGADDTPPWLFAPIKGDERPAMKVSPVLSDPSFAPGGADYEARNPSSKSSSLPSYARKAAPPAPAPTSSSPSSSPNPFSAPPPPGLPGEYPTMPRRTTKASSSSSSSRLKRESAAGGRWPPMPRSPGDGAAGDNGQFTYHSGGIPEVPSNTWLLEEDSKWWNPEAAKDKKAGEEEGHHHQKRECPSCKEAPKAAGKGGSTSSTSSSVTHTKVNLPVVQLPVQLEDWMLYLFEDFQHGAAAWSSNFVSSCGGNSILGGYGSSIGKPQGEVFTTYTKLPHHTHLRIRANFYMIDHWTGEMAYMKIDDVTVWSSTCPQCNADHGMDVCGNTNSPDKIGFTIDVPVPHDSSQVKLAFGSTLQADTFVHSWGVTNIEVYLLDHRDSAYLYGSPYLVDYDVYARKKISQHTTTTVTKTASAACTRGPKVVEAVDTNDVGAAVYSHLRHELVGASDKLAGEGKAERSPSTGSHHREETSKESDKKGEEAKDHTPPHPAAFNTGSSWTDGPSPSADAVHAEEENLASNNGTEVRIGDVSNGAYNPKGEVRSRDMTGYGSKSGGSNSNVGVNHEFGPGGKRRLPEVEEMQHRREVAPSHEENSQAKHGDNGAFFVSGSSWEGGDSLV